MIRIDILSQDPDQAVMRVAGWVQYDRDIELLAREGNRCLETSRLLVLDLEALHQLSDGALPLLRQWHASGRMQILACHLQIGFMLRHEGLIASQGGRP